MKKIIKQQFPKVINFADYPLTIPSKYIPNLQFPSYEYKFWWIDLYNINEKDNNPK